MEKKLETLFGYQRFAENADLQQVINSVHARYSGKKNSRSVRELTMDELDMVAAAGSPYEEKKNNEFTQHGTDLHGIPQQGHGIPSGKDQ